MYVLTQLPVTSRIWQVNFKLSSASLNSEFFFSLTGCYIKVIESSIPNYLSIVGEKIIRSIPFPRELVEYVKCKQPYPGFELASLRPLHDKSLRILCIYTPKNYYSTFYLLFSFVGSLNSVMNANIQLKSFTTKSNQIHTHTHTHIHTHIVCDG